MSCLTLGAGVRPREPVSLLQQCSTVTFPTCMVCKLLHLSFMYMNTISCGQKSQVNSNNRSPDPATSTWFPADAPIAPVAFASNHQNDCFSASVSSTQRNAITHSLSYRNNGAESEMFWPCGPVLFPQRIRNLHLHTYHFYMSTQYSVEVVVSQCGWWFLIALPPCGTQFKG